MQFSDSYENTQCAYFVNENVYNEFGSIVNILINGEKMTSYITEIISLENMT